MDNRLLGVLDMLEGTTIQVAEASDELRHYCDRLDLDPNRLFELERHTPKQISLACKHHVNPKALPRYCQSLLEGQRQLNGQADSQETLTLVVTKHHQQALKITRVLYQQHQQYAEELTQLITDSVHALLMPHRQSTIDVEFDERHLGVDGADRIEFRVITSPGQPTQPIVKVAPGGKSSCVALTIQVTMAHKVETPALVFGEVDVGISGPAAVVVDKLLRQLGESTQVVCVTHLPQIAGCSHQHYLVSKGTDGAITETHIQSLDKKAWLQELACLLGDSEVIRNALANAKELLVAQIFFLLHGQSKQ